MEGVINSRAQLLLACKSIKDVTDLSLERIELLVNATVVFRCFEAARLLVQKNLDVNMKLPHSLDTLLVDLTCIKHTSIRAEFCDRFAELLISHGADINVYHMRTPLLAWAAMYGRANLIRILCRHGARVTFSSTNDMPLFFAVHRRCVGAAIALLECGAPLLSHPGNLDTVPHIRTLFTTEFPKRIQKCRRAVDTLVAIRNHRAHLCGALGQLDKKVVHHISLLLWDSRRLPVWSNQTSANRTKRQKK